MMRNISSWEPNSREYISYHGKARHIFGLLDKKIGDVLTSHRLTS